MSHSTASTQISPGSVNIPKLPIINKPMVKIKNPIVISAGTRRRMSISLHDGIYVMSVVNPAERVSNTKMSGYRRSSMIWMNSIIQLGFVVMKGLRVTSGSPLYITASINI